MERNGLLIVISGPSGVGKGTVCAKLLAAETALAVSVSHTTRVPREGEIEGVNYFFTSKPEFEANIQQDRYLEWAEVYGNFYGTPRDFVEKNISLGIDTLLEIDTQGAIAVQKAFPEGVFIFLLPPSREELLQRLQGRNTDDEATIRRRHEQFTAELDSLHHYDYVVVNEDLADTVAKIQAIMTAEHLKFENCTDYIRFFGGN